MLIKKIKIDKTQNSKSISFQDQVPPSGLGKHKLQKSDKIPFIK